MLLRFTTSHHQTMPLFGEAKKARIYSSSPKKLEKIRQRAFIISDIIMSTTSEGGKNVDEKTKKILKNTGLFAAAVGITAAKTVKWSAEKVWEHKEDIAGGIVGGAKGVYRTSMGLR